MLVSLVVRKILTFSNSALLPYLGGFPCVNDSSLKNEPSVMPATYANELKNALNSKTRPDVQNGFTAKSAACDTRCDCVLLWRVHCLYPSRRHWRRNWGRATCGDNPGER